MWKESFKNLAALGIALAIVGAVIAGALMLGDSARSERNDNGVLTKKGNVNALEIVVGDCYQDNPKTTELSSVSAVPCDQPHTAQVYGVFTYPDASTERPDRNTLLDAIRPGCAALRQTAVDDGKMPTGAAGSELIPDAASWLLGRHDSLCVVTSGTAWTGTVLKA